MISRLFVYNDLSGSEIARLLNEQGVPSKRGMKWSYTTVLTYVSPMRASSPSAGRVDNIVVDRSRNDGNKQNICLKYPPYIPYSMSGSQ
jgi:hypothetical protein